MALKLLVVFVCEAMEDSEPSGLYLLPGKMTFSREVCFKFKPDLLAVSSQVLMLESVLSTKELFWGVLGCRYTSSAPEGLLALWLLLSERALALAGDVSAWRPWASAGAWAWEALLRALPEALLVLGPVLPLAPLLGRVVVCVLLVLLRLLWLWLPLAPLLLGLLLPAPIPAPWLLLAPWMAGGTGAGPAGTSWGREAMLLLLETLLTVLSVVVALTWWIWSGRRCKMAGSLWV